MRPPSGEYIGGPPSLFSKEIIVVMVPDLASDSLRSLPRLNTNDCPSGDQDARESAKSSPRSSMARALRPFMSDTTSELISLPKGSLSDCGIVWVKATLLLVGDTEVLPFVKTAWSRESVKVARCSSRLKRGLAPASGTPWRASDSPGPGGPAPRCRSGSSHRGSGSRRGPSRSS